MKTKIVSLLLLFATIAYNASAFKIIIRGGTSNHTYYEIIVTDNLISCTGRGNNYCPADWSNNDAHTRIAGIPIGEVTNYVLRQVEGGNKEGQIEFEGRLPLYWRMLDDENVEIDIKSDDVTGLEKYE